MVKRRRGPGAFPPFPTNWSTSLGAVGHDSRGAFSSTSRGTVAGRSRPARQTHPRPLISGPTGGTTGDLSCTVRLCQGDEPGGRPSCRPCSGRLHSCGGCVGLPPSSPTSLGRTVRGADANLCLGTPDHPGIARPPDLRAGPFNRALGPGSRPGTHQILLTTGVVNGTFSYLNGCLPLAERAAACSGSGGGLALACPPPRGWAKRCPKLRETCVLTVWMRSVDDWPLAKILPRFLGVSYGR